jgi:L-aspartate oxidase
LNLQTNAGSIVADRCSPEIAERTAQVDVIVIGAGVAGLAFALSMPVSTRVALLTKGNMGESNTRWAQGGIAAAIGADDTVELHEQDTLYAGAGLSDPESVHELLNDGPEAIDWLLSLGTAFDRDDSTGELELGREAAHSRRRVLHAGGDATGAEIERALVAAVRSRPNVEILESSFAIDTIVRDGRCVGALIALKSNEIVAVEAQTVVLAAGGAGQLWATTSNPPAATADGIAIAMRARAAVADLEFCQFHPTVLQLPGETPFLVSEAVRGEGAYLRDRAGRRFMLAEHEMAELAPRDVVARGIQKQMAADSTDHVYLDLRHLDGPTMRRRFPTIARELDARGLDLATDLIPVAPAAHYFMGGVVANSEGVTSLPGLLAIGEAACTGVHGANRLASNSLLEGLVFGRKAAESVNLAPGRIGGVIQTPLVEPEEEPQRSSPGRHRSEIQQIMSRHVSVVRDAVGLTTAICELAGIADALESAPSGRDAWITANMVQAAHTIATAALLREESRGAHYREDFPHRDVALGGVHFIFQNVESAGDTWSGGSLALVLPVAGP